MLRREFGRVGGGIWGRQSDNRVWGSPYYGGDSRFLGAEETAAGLRKKSAACATKQSGMSTAAATGLRCALFVVLALAIAPGAARGATAPGLRQLRFSPDGRYVLAQDDAGITVLTAQPFAVLFQVPTQDATIADFTPDSHQILFVSSLTQVTPQQIAIVSSPAHVERWSIVDRKRISFTEITLPACGTVSLSPDGSFVACDDLGGAFHLYEVASGATVLKGSTSAKPI